MTRRRASLPAFAVALAVVGLGLAGSAAAAPHKVLVLPLDGNADVATRGKLNARIARLARGLDGQVAVAETTFADTALAVGCDPQAAGCSDLVMATLGVDELVWGTASKDGGNTRLAVWRAAKGQPPRQTLAMIAASDSGERIDSAVAPVFTRPAPASRDASAARPPARDAAVATPTAREPAAAPPAQIATPAREPAAPPPAPVGQQGPLATTDDRRDRSLGIALVAGGGVALVLGIALLASYSSVQTSIDHHATRNRNDFDDLTALENKASTYAIAGDVAVVIGVAAGSLGAYYLFRDHRRHRVAITPAPIAGGAGLVLTIRGVP